MPPLLQCISWTSNIWQIAHRQYFLSEALWVNPLCIGHKVRNKGELKGWLLSPWLCETGLKNLHSNKVRSTHTTGKNVTQRKSKLMRWCLILQVSYDLYPFYISTTFLVSYIIFCIDSFTQNHSYLKPSLPMTELVERTIIAWQSGFYKVQNAEDSCQCG